MSGEMFEQDKVLRYGWPWHGMWSGNHLVLGNGQPCPSTVFPAAPSTGDCYLLKKPGLPDVVNRQADLDAGIELRNYALICGKNSAWMTVNLGDLAWIYIAPDGVPWRVRPVNVLKTTLMLYFYNIWDGFSTVRQVINLTFNSGAAYWNPPVGYSWITEDVHPQGHEVCLGYRPLGSKFQNPDLNSYNFLSRIRISGTPPAATAVWDRTGIDSAHVETETNLSGYVDRHVWIDGAWTDWQDTLSNYPTPMPAGYEYGVDPYYEKQVITSAVRRVEEVVGAMYEPSGDFRLIKFVYEATATTTDGFNYIKSGGGGLNWSGSGTVSIESTYSIKLGDDAIASMAGSASLTKYITANGTLAKSVDEFSYSSAQPPIGSTTRVFSIAPSEAWDYDGNGGFGTFRHYNGFGYNTWTVLHPQTKVVGLDKNPQSGTRSLRLVARLGAQKTISPYVQTSTYYITCQPVTGQLEFSTTPICFM